MRNTIFFIVLIFLLAGCNGKGPTLELKTKVEVTSKDGMPVKIDVQEEKPLPVKIDAKVEEPLPIRMVPDEVVSRAVVAFFVVAVVIAVATVGAAITAWRAACNTKKALEIIKNKIGE